MKAIKKEQELSFLSQDVSNVMDRERDWERRREAEIHRVRDRERRRVGR